MRSNRWRVYLKPFNDSGVYTDWIECSDDVELSSLGTIDQSLDNTDFNIGIYKNSDFQVTFRNDSGRYSDVGQPQSIFRYTRSNTLFKITWQGNDEQPMCGFAVAGNTVLAPETVVFKGLLSDKSTTMDLQTQELQFDVLGRETLFNNDFFPFALVAPQIPCTISIATPAVVEYSGNPNIMTNGVPIQFQANNTYSGGAVIEGTLPAPLNASVYDVEEDEISGSTSATTYYVCQNVEDTPVVQFTIASSLDDVGSAANPAGSPVSTDGGTQSGQASFCILGGHSIFDLVVACISQVYEMAELIVDPANVTLGVNSILDDITDFNGMTIWDALSDLLLISNSVLYIKGDTVIVAPRVASTDVQYTFYGQTSQLGPENIQDIQRITNGIPRVFNYLYWQSGDTTMPWSTLQTDDVIYGSIQNTVTSVAVQNADSINKYGLISKQFSQTYIYNSTVWTNLLTNILSEFGEPKQEFDLYTPMTYDVLALFLLDKISIDYPVVYMPGPEPLPICGTAVCGEAVTPIGIWSFLEVPTNYYKIEGTSIDPQTNLICISMRRV